MTQLTQHIVSLGETLAAHRGTKHWSVSKEVSGKGDFIHRMMNGKDTVTDTYLAVMGRFDEIWPADLEWPNDVPRPKKHKKEAA